MRDGEGEVVKEMVKEMEMEMAMSMMMAVTMAQWWRAKIIVVDGDGSNYYRGDGDSVHQELAVDYIV